jgi:hypothetical protein
MEIASTGWGQLAFANKAGIDKRELPGRRPVEERYRTDPLTVYASNLEHMMADVRGPDLWVQASAQQVRLRRRVYEGRR